MNSFSSLAIVGSERPKGGESWLCIGFGFGFGIHYAGRNSSTIAVDIPFNLQFIL
jgi:hypothetical protein